MQVFVTVVFVGGAIVFCAWSLINLIGAIKDRKAKRRKEAESVVIDEERKED